MVGKTLVVTRMRTSAGVAALGARASPSGKPKTSNVCLVGWQTDERNRVLDINQQEPPPLSALTFTLQTVHQLHHHPVPLPLCPPLGFGPSCRLEAYT